MGAWIASFGRFWYHFVVGDDWMIAAAVVGGLAVSFALSRTGLGAWWLMPVAAILSLALSLWRGRRTA